MPSLAPPTPPVPLADLLARADLGLRQVAGPREDIPVHWVHTSEMEDPVPYLLGGELLLTAGVHFPSASDTTGRRKTRPDDAGRGATDDVGAGQAEDDDGGVDDAYLDHYVARAVEAGAAALGFGLAPVYDRTPRALVEACDRYALPLVEVPPQTPFTAVARAVWQAMAEARHRELRRVTEAQQSLASAAARPEPVPAVLRQLAHHLGGWAALLGPGGGELYGAGARPGPPVRAALGQLAQVVRPLPGNRSQTVQAPSSATDTVAGAHLAAYALAGSAPGEGLVLAVAAGRRDPADNALTGVATVLLSLLTGPYQGTADTDRSAALVRLLLGARPEDVAPLLTGPTRPAETDSGAEHPEAAGPHWIVVHGHHRGSGPTRGEAAPLAAAALAAALGTALVDADGVAAVRALLPADRRISAQPGWTLGVSAPASTAELSAADAQAAGALRRAVANRSGLARHRGGGAGMTALVAPEEARAQARALLAPLLDSPALVETLRAWLALHGSWDRSAVALEVHRNTVRQRVARTAALLDADLDDPDTRMDLWFALRWL
ncbi:PucR family transcriptional regulator ligand-binding domain-containing protein [Streptomyces sp. RKAG337]|uniref:PucR family transcriptional regulator ligand-binding domain-containing protein n=1 Tax=Streptomyces sp. RKAG337 TaxID=2893404 RepID=UPI002033F01D|nr:PucR family transcriptional regulator [Streptomyces sp. RKAG337]MCM2428321.1 PucR family transcriptional regulator [Streptomyces sp. RKAG337]